MRKMTSVGLTVAALLGAGPIAAETAVSVFETSASRPYREIQLQVRFRGAYASFQIPRQTVATIVLKHFEANGKGDK